MGNQCRIRARAGSHFEHISLYFLLGFSLLLGSLFLRQHAFAESAKPLQRAWPLSARNMGPLPGFADSKAQALRGPERNTPKKRRLGESHEAFLLAWLENDCLNGQKKRVEKETDQRVAAPREGGFSLLPANASSGEPGKGARLGNWSPGCTHPHELPQPGPA